MERVCGAPVAGLRSQVPLSKGVLLVFAALLLLVGLWFFRKSSLVQPEPPNSQKITEGSDNGTLGAQTPKVAFAPVLATEVPRSAAVSTPDISDLLPKAEEKQAIAPPKDGTFIDFGSFSAPTIFTYRSEVARDLHGTPPSLLEMAREVSRKIQELKSGSGDFQALRSELQDCGAHKEIPPSAAQFCTEIAKELQP